MRASVAPSRQSQLLGSVASAAAAARLVEKKKEFEAVAALERASAQFLNRIEELGNDFDVMADAGIGEHPVSLHTRSLSNTFHHSTWPSTGAVAQYVSYTEHVSYAILASSDNPYSSYIAVAQREQGVDGENASSGTTGERLVRVPVEELRQPEPTLA